MSAWLLGAMRALWLEVWWLHEAKDLRAAGAPASFTENMPASAAALLRLPPLSVSAETPRAESARSGVRRLSDQVIVERRPEVRRVSTTPKDESG